MMLARTAEYLFWAGRYLERAENTARLLDVTYHRLLEANPGEEIGAWSDVIASVGLPEEFAATGRSVSGHAVTAFLVLEGENDGAIVSCVARARDNARGVREHLANELWEELNSFHLALGARNLARDLAREPHELYGFVRRGVQSIMGVANETWSREDAWRFFTLGVLLERSEMGIRALRVRHPRHRDDAVHEWYATLRSQSALQAYRRRYRDLDSSALVELLLLSPTLPRSVLFSLLRAERILIDLTRANVSERSLAPRLLGRVRAEIEFADAAELVGGDFDGTLARYEADVRIVSTAVAAECFHYRVDGDLHSVQLVPGVYLPDVAVEVGT